MKCLNDLLPERVISALADQVESDQTQGLGQ